jgi:hypothetical protein
MAEYHAGDLLLHRYGAAIVDGWFDDEDMPIVDSFEIMDGDGEPSLCEDEDRCWGQCCTKQIAVGVARPQP